MPPVEELTKEEKKQLEKLTEKREAYDAEQDSLRKERTAKVDTVKDLIDLVDTKIEEKATSAFEAATKDFRSEISKLADTVNGLVDDINSLGKKSTEHAGGGIGYDHGKAIEEAKEKGDSEQKGVFKISRAIIGHINGWRGPYKDLVERQLLEEFQTKALQMGVSSAGGFMVPPQWMSEVIELLRPNLVVRALGARFRPLQGPTSFRKLQGGATSYWTAEGRKATASQPEWGRINLTPKPLVTLVPVSEDLLAMGPDGLQSDIEEDMGRSQAESLDLAILKGDGGEAEPLGIVNLAGGTTDWSSADYAGADQTVTDLLDEMVYAPGGRKVRGGVGFALPPLGIQKLRQVKDANGAPLLFDAGQRGHADPQDPNGGVETGTLWGRPYATSTALSYGTAEDDLIAAVWSEVIVASFGLTEIRPSMDASDPDNNTSAFLQREMWVRMTSRWDAALRHNQAVQVATGWDNTPS